MPTAIDPLAGPLVADLPTLLSTLGLADLAALSTIVEGYASSPAWVPAISEQDSLPERLQICVATHALYLKFPFNVDQMWNQIDDLEAEIETQQHITAFWMRIE